MLMSKKLGLKLLKGVDDLDLLKIFLNGLIFLILKIKF